MLCHPRSIAANAPIRLHAALPSLKAIPLAKSKATPAVQIVASMIRAVAAKKASDIHIEPQSSETSIRLRIDGILREHQRVPWAFLI